LTVVRIVNVGTKPEHVEITPDGRWIIVARPEAGELVMLDSKGLTVVRKIAVGEEPHQMVFVPGR
jgi:DNA-binding beta-propeller fold protein YncE